MIWSGSAKSHTALQLRRRIRGRTDGSIRLRADLLKNRLHLMRRPQIESSRPQSVRVLALYTQSRRPVSAEAEWSGDSPHLKLPGILMIERPLNLGSPFFSVHLADRK